jgi:uncharacterized protein YndB with AHSA1/START domain
LYQFNPLIITTMSTNGKAETTKKLFSRETKVSIAIQATPQTIWALLTNAKDYPKWNATVVSIEGNIALGDKIQLKSTLDPKRVFKLTVKAFVPEQRLVWGDAMGKRTFELKPMPNGYCNFSMVEKIGGPLFPLFARMIPPFDESFEKFAEYIKIAAEKVA